MAFWNVPYDADVEGLSDSDEDYPAEREYRRRIHPMDEFSQIKFRQRYRVTKPVAQRLIEDFTNFIPLLGETQGGAVSIPDRVSMHVSICL